MVLSYLAYQRKKDLKKEELELQKEEFYYNVVYDEKVNLLDTIVQEEAEKYYIFKLGFLKEEDKYLNDTDQKLMISELISTIVKTRLTPMILSNIRLYYKADTMEEIINVISSKVSVYVLDLAISMNSKK